MSRGKPRGKIVGGTCQLVWSSKWIQYFFSSSLILYILAFNPCVHVVCVYFSRRVTGMQNKRAQRNNIFVEVVMYLRTSRYNKHCQVTQKYTWPSICIKALAAAVSELNCTNPYPFDFPVTWSHITFTEKHEYANCLKRISQVHRILRGYYGLGYITLDYFTLLSKSIFENIFIGIIRKPCKQYKSWSHYKE